MSENQNRSVKINPLLKTQLAALRLNYMCYENTPLKNIIVLVIFVVYLRNAI